MAKNSNRKMYAIKNDGRLWETEIDIDKVVKIYTVSAGCVMNEDTIFIELEDRLCDLECDYVIFK